MGQGVVTPVDLAIVFRGNLWNGNINIDPVPEPNTLGVILVGGIALAAALRRR
ncbi:MAG: PEP-CTERM sorting domain-containing protein [Fimbriimonadia bacterium]